MRIYISAPIAGYNMGERQRFFASKAERVKSKGHDPVNPMEGVNLNMKRAAIMRKDLQQLLSCDGIMMCQGWEHSQGCTLEHAVARECGLAFIAEV